jgi:intergrase/recombinase
MGKIVQWGCLVGLRPAEIVESVKLINDKEAFAKYYDPVQMTLFHWKYPQFVRTTKKAFVSFVSPPMVEIVQNVSSDKMHQIPTYNAIRLTCQRRGITCDMRFCRKIFASWLHKCGESAELIDLLQGRCGRSVFVNHYLTPGADYKDRILIALDKLHRELLL